MWLSLPFHVESSEILNIRIDQLIQSGFVTPRVDSVYHFPNVIRPGFDVLAGYSPAHDSNVVLAQFCRASCGANPAHNA